MALEIIPTSGRQTVPGHDKPDDGRDAFCCERPLSGRFDRRPTPPSRCAAV